MSIPPTIEVASLGMWDSLILMVMALVVFGPRRMPEIGRQIGKLMYELRKASSDFKFQMEEELRNAEESDQRKKEAERLQTLALAPPAGTVSQVPDAGAEAPVSVESPYPGENHYPYPPDDPAARSETAAIAPEVRAVLRAEEAERAEDAALPGPAATEASRVEEQGAENSNTNQEETPAEPVNGNG